MLEGVILNGYLSFAYMNSQQSSVLFSLHSLCKHLTAFQLKVKGINMYACLYICMYVGVYIFMYGWMYVCIYLFVYGCLHICMYVYNYVTYILK